MRRWLSHPLFAPVLALAALGWGTLLMVFLLVGPKLGGWAEPLLTICFGWNAATRAYRLDAVLFLTLQPPLFVLAVGFFYADDLSAFIRRLGGRVVSAAAVLGFVATAGVLVASGDVVAGGRPLPAGLEPIRDSRRAPSELLTDHRGKPFDPGEAWGIPIALTFVYTSCHASCPTLVATMKSTAALVGDRALFVVVTLDPERDTRAALAGYAERWSLGGSWRLLTGPRAAVDRLRGAYGIRAERLADGEIAHENVIVLIDRAGRVAYTYRGLGQSPEDLARALVRLAGERA
jgi:protein SCO1/2